MKCMAKLPGPAARSAAMLPAADMAAMPLTAPSSGLGATAAWAATSTVAVQPMPVTRGINSCPPVTSTTSSPSVTRSTGPLTTVTQWWRRDRARAESAAACASRVESTPRVPPAAPARAMISDPLPRTMHGRTRSMICAAVVVRRVDAPAPTGSSTTGMPRSRAAAPARNMLSIHGALRVPMFSTSAETMFTSSAISSRAWAMMGEAPAASSALAVTFMTTKLVMLCTRGASRRTALTLRQICSMWGMEPSLGELCISFAPPKKNKEQGREIRKIPMSQPHLTNGERRVNPGMRWPETTPAAAVPGPPRCPPRTACRTR